MSVIWAASLRHLLRHPAQLALALVGLALGQRYPSLPTFGLPCPTTIFTIAVLIRLDRLAPVALYVIPLIWSVIALMAAISFGVGEDFLLLPFVAIGLGLRLWRTRPQRVWA